MSETGDFWDKQFEQTNLLTTSELVKLERQFNVAKMASADVFSKEFTTALDTFIDTAIELKKIIGVIQYTKRWKHGRARKETSGEGSG